MNGLTRTLIMAAVCLTAAGPVQAEGWFFQMHGGVGLFNLDDVNAGIDRLNAGQSKVDLNKIHSGLDAGLHVGYDLTAELGLGLGISRLWSSSGYSRDGYLVEYDLPADLYEISLDYLPANRKNVRVGAGATLGLINSGASLLVGEPNGPDRIINFDGVGFHFAGYGIMDVRLAAAWSLLGQAGFRHAIISHLEVDGETVYNPDSIDDKLRFNYSGLFLRVGIKFRP